MRMSFAVFCSCILLAFVALSAPAQAGEYSGGGYRHGGYYDGGYRGHGDHYGVRRGRSVWYSSNCCYQRVVRHTAYYEPVRRHYSHQYRPYRYSYDVQPYRRSYYDRPYYRSNYEYGYGGYRGYRSVGYTSGHYVGGYDAYNSCAVARVRIPDGRGGWVWGTAAGC